jgi:N-acetylmuramic acid 6-phosphate etherase
MKAGTAQKMVLNMLSTGALTQVGYVYGNLMVNLRTKNSKLRERGIGIIQKVTGKNRRTAEKALHDAGSTATALVMIQGQVNRKAAEEAFRSAGQNVSRAITVARRQNKALIPRRRSGLR